MEHLHNKIFRQGSKTYYNSSRFFPRKIRKDVAILYAFVRIADNFVDAIPADRTGFYLFREQYRSALSGKISGNPIIDSFIELMKRKDFSPEWIDAFFHSMELDLKKTAYRTIEETLEYIYGSAEVIGLFMSRIMGLPETATDAAAMQGRAMQYINFIRDINEDNQLGRRYLPLSDSGLNSLSEADSRAHPEEFIRYIRHEIQRYLKWQQEADRGFHVIPKRQRIPIRTAADMYRWTSDRIYKNPFIVFQKKVKPSRMRILFSAGLNMFR